MESEIANQSEQSAGDRCPDDDVQIVQIDVQIAMSGSWYVKARTYSCSRTRTASKLIVASMMM
jgi:hypothetical protein